MGRTRNTNGGGEVHKRFWWGKPEWKSPLGRHRLRWEDNIKIDLQKVDWIVLAQNRDL